MNSLKRTYVRLAGWAGPVCLSAFLLLMRAVYGWGFYQSGKGKWSALRSGSEDGPIAFFRELGIPAPAVNAWVVAVVETVGGLLLLAGIGSRLVSIVLSGTMIVALLTAHKDATMDFIKNQEMMPFMRQTPFWFLVTTVLVIAVGPGLFSVDALLKRFVFRIPRKPNAVDDGYDLPLGDRRGRSFADTARR